MKNTLKQSTMHKKYPESWHAITMLIFAVLIILSFLILIFLDKLKAISALDITLLCLASFRITRVIVYDAIADFIRNYFANLNNGFGDSMYQLVNCPWCTGIWVSFVLVFLYLLFPAFWYFVLVFAIASLAMFVQFIFSLISRIGNN